MGFAHNNVLHANHFRKDWQRRVRTWFDQPGRKLRRRNARKTKAAALGVRPLTLLRPAVRGQTVRYNRKLREGRGFTLAELKEAGIGRKEARGVGIVVDHRRRNLSEEGKKLNVERLLAYKQKLIVFPRRAGKPKKGDSSASADDLSAATTRVTLPLPESYPAEPPRKITAEERSFEAYQTLRTARANARHEGVRKARAAKASFFLIFSLLLTVGLIFLSTERRRGSRQEKVIVLAYNMIFFLASCVCPLAKLLRRSALTLYALHVPMMLNMKCSR
ncbi:hypothetical protein GYMLUDRAFT_210549 [Collybiopsis luxurians FD-317 M1]|nr:hypothetical protein GYMLUDRAFT_210549 [Collybiopsis luxurians FD-317 M1]